MNNKQLKGSIIALFLLTITTVFSQKIPSISKDNQLIVNEKPFIMLGGELHNSSSSSMEYMESKWKNLVDMNLNTVLAAISWEMIEPQEGVYDFSSLDNLVVKAREHNLKLVILWFGTWKNACSSYAPEWVRMDTKRFFRSEVNGEKLNHISCFCKEALDADSKAFAKLMSRIKETDEKEQTILSVQVENEVGMRWIDDKTRMMPRDMSPKANEAYTKQVPTELMSFLEKNRSILLPEFIKIWARSNFKSSGTWTEIFLADAPEVFMAWHSSSYVNKVAEAGKKIYPLPMFANVWNTFGKVYEDEFSNTYPSGSAVPKMLPVWKAGAPFIDAIAPDFYRESKLDFMKVINQYKKMNNPLLVPEISKKQSSVMPIYTMGMGAICYSPFGIDGGEIDTELTASYAFLRDFAPYLAKYHGTGKMTGFYGESESERIEMGKYVVKVDYGNNDWGVATETKKGSSGIIIAVSEDEFIVVGNGRITVSFETKSGKPKKTEILNAYELVFKNNQWVKERRLNGDETGSGAWHHTKVYYHRGISVKSIKVFSYE